MDVTESKFHTHTQTHTHLQSLCFVSISIARLKNPLYIFNTFSILYINMKISNVLAVLRNIIIINMYYRDQWDVALYCNVYNSFFL